MKAGPLFGTSLQPTRATIGTGRKQPSRACWRGLLVDARGERLTASHAVKKGRRYRYYVSGALITEAGTDRPQGWRLAAQEIEDAVIRVLADALTRPAMLLERFDTAGIPGDQTSRMLDR